MRWLIGSAVLLPFFISTATSQDTTHVRIEWSGVAASFEVPATVQFAKDSKRNPDFNLYRASVGERSILTIYVGRYPQRISGLHPAKIGKCYAESVESHGGEGKARNVYVGFFRGQITFHFFYDGLTAAEAQLSDAIINSLTADGQSPCDS
jgi:hypothetical protein